MHSNFFADLAIRVSATIVIGVTICVVSDYFKHKDAPKAKNT